MNEIVTPPYLADRYRFERKLGAGGQGTTYLAERLKDGVKVAVKTLHVAALENWKALELFEREAKLLSAVSLAGVPKVFEYGSEDDAGSPRFYLVQEYLEGESAGELLARGYRFTEGEAINLAWQVLGILSELHALSPPVIHRDVKPSNIIVKPDHVCALVDFGSITGVLKQSGGSTGSGTFGYMAPEQLSGRATAASDVYSVGATMAHLLSGIPPTEMESHLFRLEFAPHCNISGTLERLLERMLDPEEEHRFASARDAQLALAALENDISRASEVLAPAKDLKELTVVGQSGSLTIFHALGRAPRKVPKEYARLLTRRLLLYGLGGGLAAFVALVGMSLFISLGLGPVELVSIVALPFILSYGLMRSRRRLKRVIGGGRKALGHVSEVRQTHEGPRLAYEFKVAGKTITGSVRLGEADVCLAHGDELGVLYDEEKPEDNLPYPLPPLALVKALEEE